MGLFIINKIIKSSKNITFQNIFLEHLGPSVYLKQGLQTPGPAS
jgi:hypothetical protein